MGDNNTIAHKYEHLLATTLYRKAIFFLTRHAKRKGVRDQILPFPEVNFVLASMMHLEKADIIDVFDELKEAGALEVIPYHGIRIREGRD